jgi:hypothetical protein
MRKIFQIIVQLLQALSSGIQPIFQLIVFVVVHFLKFFKKKKEDTFKIWNKDLSS